LCLFGHAQPAKGARRTLSGVKRRVVALCPVRWLHVGSGIRAVVGRSPRRLIVASIVVGTRSAGGARLRVIRAQVTESSCCLVGRVARALTGHAVLLVCVRRAAVVLVSSVLIVRCCWARILRSIRCRRLVRVACGLAGLAAYRVVDVAMLIVVAAVVRRHCVHLFSSVSLSSNANVKGDRQAHMMRLRWACFCRFRTRGRRSCGG